jgi:hypothetical protein
LNFFGHAVTARWVSASPAFAWGAMLPDLVAMIGSRIVSIESEAVRRGLAFHHHSDRIFHHDPTFASLESAARARLQVLGVSKGPRRALSHVGPELILDGFLSRRRENVDAYRAALSEGALRPGISLRGVADGAALRALAATLSARAGRLAPRTPGELVDRMERVLGRRPALCFDPGERAGVLTWAEETMPRVEALAEQWLRDLRNELSQPGSGTTEGLFGHGTASD